MNKIKLQGLLGLLVVALSLAAWGAGSAVYAQSTPKPPSTQPGAGEKHPMLGKALLEMRHAKAYMEHTESEFGGHKKSAMDALDKAIGELKLAIAADK